LPAHGAQLTANNPLISVIILSEDHSLSAQLARAMWKHGIAAVVAITVDEALGLLEIDRSLLGDRSLFDVLVADLHIDGCDAVFLARCAKKRQPKIKILYMTASNGNFSHFDGIVLVKPVNGDKLLRAIKSVMA
jgi:DNA-binding response OmpR family regulator